MGIVDWLKGFGEVAAEAQPIVINVQGQDAFIRNAQRIATLYLAMEQGDERESLRRELNARLEAVIKMGHGAPVSHAQAVRLVQKVSK